MYPAFVIPCAFPSLCAPALYISGSSIFYPLIYPIVCSPCITRAFPSLCVPPVYPSYIPRVFSKRPSWCVSFAMFSPDKYTRYIHLISLRTSHSVIPMHSPSVSFPVCSPSISPAISVLYPRISPRVFPIDSPCAFFVMCSFGISPGISPVYPPVYPSYIPACVLHAFPLCFLPCVLRYSKPSCIHLWDLHTFPVPRTNNSSVTTELVLSLYYLVLR